MFASARPSRWVSIATQEARSCTGSRASRTSGRSRVRARNGRYRPFRARTRERPDVPEAREPVPDLAPGVAIETQREGLADANIRERLHGVVHRDVEVDDEGGLLDDDLVAELLPDRFHLGEGQVAELDVGAPGPDRRRAHGRLRADVELVPVEVWPVLDEVVGVALTFERRPARVAL